MIEKLCALLESKNPEVRIAAATVLRELKIEDKPVRTALEKALKTDNDMVRSYVLGALEAMGLEKSLPKLVPLLGAARPLRERLPERMAGPRRRTAHFYAASGSTLRAAFPPPTRRGRSSSPK